MKNPLGLLGRQNAQRKEAKQSVLEPPPPVETRIETQVGITQDKRISIMFSKPVTHWLLTPQSAISHAKAMLQGVKMTEPALLKDFEP